MQVGSRVAQVENPALLRRATDLELGLLMTNWDARLAVYLQGADDPPAVIRVKLVGGQGIDLVFETGQETAGDLWAFLDHLEDRGVTNLGVNFDPANMILYDKGDPIEALRRLLPRVRSIHIKDAVRTDTPGEWGAEAVVGEGQVDWPAFLRVLAEGGYAGDLLVEREWGDDRVGAARTAIDVITRVMGETG